jgi:hypothetical protein
MILGQPSVTAPNLALIAIGMLFVVLLIAGVHVWYALTLSKVFRKLGAEGWKAWVPILNESEILRLGGVPAWMVIFYVIPIVGFYGLYLKATALSRVNAHFGHGVGSTVLGILLPPVWSTLLAAGGSAPDPGLQERIATSVEPRSGYAFAVSTPQQPAAEPSPPPTVPVPAGGVPPLAPPVAAPAPPMAPPLPPVAPAMPVLPPPPLGVAPPPPPAVPAAPPPPVAPTLPPAAPAPTPTVAAPPPPVVTAPPSTLIVPPPSLIPPPPVVAAPVVVPAAPEMPAQPWAPIGPGPVAPPTVDEPADGMPEELDRTVVVDRRPVVPWRLVVDGGPTFRLSGSSAILGRRPSGSGAGSQEIAVPDSTRTLSKVHARLDLADGVWTVTDLNATNGVIVIEADGSENLLEPGASAVVRDRFVLGKVAMLLSFGEDATSS